LLFTLRVIPLVYWGKGISWCSWWSLKARQQLCQSEE
jgi:hypothetical protein